MSKTPGCCSVTCVVWHLLDHRVPSPNAALQCQPPGLDMALGSSVTLRRAEGKSSAFPGGRGLKLKCFVKKIKRRFFLCTRLCRWRFSSATLEWKRQKQNENRVVLLPRPLWVWPHLFQAAESAHHALTVRLKAHSYKNSLLIYELTFFLMLFSWVHVIPLHVQSSTINPFSPLLCSSSFSDVGREQVPCAPTLTPSPASPFCFVICPASDYDIRSLSF